MKLIGTKPADSNPTPLSAEEESAQRDYETAADRAIGWFVLGLFFGFAFACLVLR